MSWNTRALSSSRLEGSPQDASVSLKTVERTNCGEDAGSISNLCKVLI